MQARPIYPAELYRLVHTGTAGDVDYYRALCRGAQSVLEVGCGDGRVLCELAVEDQERELCGLDVDADLLNFARERSADLPAGARRRLHWIEDDVREFDLGRTFDRILLPYGVLYCLLDEASQRQALERIAAHLKPGGVLGLDVWAADGFHNEASPEDLSPHELQPVKTIRVEGRPWEVLEASEWRPAEQRIDVTYVHVPEGEEEGRMGQLWQRYLLAEQLRALLDTSGFELEGFWGGFEEQDYDGEAELMVVSARRR